MDIHGLRPGEYLSKTSADLGFPMTSPSVVAVVIFMLVSLFYWCGFGARCASSLEGLKVMPSGM
jgi:hypothetical protein